MLTQLNLESDDKWLNVFKLGRHRKFVQQRTKLGNNVWMHTGRSLQCVALEFSITICHSLYIVNETRELSPDKSFWHMRTTQIFSYTLKFKRPRKDEAKLGWGSGPYFRFDFSVWHFKKGKDISTPNCMSMCTQRLLSYYILIMELNYSGGRSAVSFTSVILYKG